MDPRFITTGVPISVEPNAPVPVRHEIRDLQQGNPLQWNLFLLGLRALQTESETDQTSFYQISGIHGLPYKAWNDVVSPDGEQSGYCTHSSILFLPWHRPYLALFEQVLYKKIQDIAKSFTSSLRSKYVSAAQDFRLPYWDWGLLRIAGQNAFPATVAGPAQIQVTGKDGKQETISNPLHQYNFDISRLSSGDFPDAPYNTWATTHRYPKDGKPNTVSQDNLVNSAIDGQNRNIRSMIRYVMGSISDFGAFSNDKWIPGQPGAFASLEDIHDNIHVLVGGPGPSNQSAPAGNMSIVPYAAFDPVFWLHHCNVDRLFALWQELHPESYVQPESTPDGTFTRPAGATEDVNADLTPFWSDPSRFYTSKSARTTRALGYAYPETQSWKFTTTALYQQSVRAAIKRLYGSTVSSSGAAAPILVQDLKAEAGFRQLSGDNDKIAPNAVIHIEDTSATSQGSKAINVAANISKKLGHPIDAISSLLDQSKAQSVSKKFDASDSGKNESSYDDTSYFADPNGNYLEWIVNIRVQKHCLNGAFQVHVFLGDVPDDLPSWIAHEHNVGTFSVLGSDPSTTGCGSCKKDAVRKMNVTGVIPLTEALMEAVRERGDLQSLEASDVEPYLMKELHWRVTQPDGTEKDRRDVSDLQVSVVSTEVRIPSAADEFPIYSGEYTLHPACTDGRPAGYGYDDEY